MCGVYYVPWVRPGRGSAGGARAGPASKRNVQNFRLVCRFEMHAATWDPIVCRTVTCVPWFNSYSSFIGDLAVHELCFGGLWISGGTAPKHFKNFISDSFLKQFSNKGRLKDIVKTIPIRIILDEEFGLHSAACRAKMLLSNQ